MCKTPGSTVRRVRDSVAGNGGHIIFGGRTYYDKYIGRGQICQLRRFLGKKLPALMQRL
jgi:hypothetical protein